MMKESDNKNETYLQEFGARLKKIRKKLSFTQKSFSEIGEVSVQSQRLYEAGDRSPNSEYLNKISSLDIDISYLVTGSSPTVSKSTKHDFRLDILTEILEVIERWSTERKCSITIQVRAELISLFYVMFCELGKVNSDLIHGYLKHVK